MHIGYGVFDIIIIITTLQWNWIGNGYRDSNDVEHMKNLRLNLLLKSSVYGLTFADIPFYAHSSVNLDIQIWANEPWLFITKKWCIKIIV